MEEENIENKEQTAGEEELSPDELLDKAEEYLAHGDQYKAQVTLNKVEKDCGRKFYLQSRIYKKRCWYNEQRKQLKAAVKAEPDNELYKKELDELIRFSKTPEYKNTKQRPQRNQLGKTDTKWYECCVEVCGYCVCEAICEGICNGCG